MSAFPDTPVTLLAHLAREVTGEDEADWARFFEMYRPVIERFAYEVGARADAEDVSQEVFIRLVDVLRNGAYKAERGRFRAYLATLIRREVVNRWYRARARAADCTVSLDDEAFPLEVAVPPATPAILDAKWQAACQAAAVEHVLTKTALSRTSCAIYRAYVLEGRPIGEVAAAFGVPRNSVSQVKTRVDRMVARYASAYGT